MTTHFFSKNTLSVLECRELDYLIDLLKFLERGNFLTRFLDTTTTIATNPIFLSHVS